MDTNALVGAGQNLVRAMDDAGVPPRLAMWVHANDTDTWKLWIVPPKTVTDKHNFYRQISQIVQARRDELGGLDASDTEMILESHPAAKGLARFIRMEGVGSARFSGNTFNGFYLPDGIIIRSAL